MCGTYMDALMCLWWDEFNVQGNVIAFLLTFVLLLFILVLNTEA